MAPDPKERLITALVDSTNAVEESTEVLERVLPILQALEEDRLSRQWWRKMAEAPLQKLAMGATAAILIVLTAGAGWFASQLASHPPTPAIHAPE